MTTQASVSVVIVSYNTRELLLACLRSLVQSDGVSIEVCVVDNGSKDGSAEAIRSAFPSVDVFENSDNRGFAAASNVGITRTHSQYVLLLNPDTTVERDTLLRLAGELDKRPDAAIVGPRVLNPDGSLQSNGYRFPSLLGEIRQSRHIGRLLRALVGEEPPMTPSGGAVSAVDWVDGCCLMIRRAVIDQIGLLDEQYFLYAEELDWCRSARKAGWHVTVCDDASMTHIRGASSQQQSARSLALLVETKLRYFRKHDGLPVALAVSVVYLLGFLKRWRDAPAKNRAKLRGVSAWWRTILTLG